MSGVIEAIDTSGEHSERVEGMQKPQDQPIAQPIFTINSDAQSLQQAATDKVRSADTKRHFGAIQNFLDDPEVEEIWINSPSRIFIAKNGVPELTTLIMTEQEVKTLVERMLATSGRRVDLSQPFVDAMLADGSRIHVVIPDVTREHWSVNIRKFVVRSHSLPDLVKIGSLTYAGAEFLQSCVDAGLNIIISGATGAGKTTMMNALLNSARASDRVVTCEEVFELQLINPDWVALQTRQPSLEGTGEVSLRRIIKEALRMRPTRLIVGEVRQGECLDLLVAMNSGMPSMCSIHANGAREAISKLCLLPMLAGSNVSAEFVIPAVAAAVDVVVHVGLLSNGARVVHEISTVSGRVEGSSIELMQVFKRGAGKLQATGFMPENLVKPGQLRSLLENVNGKSS
jgi:pilus assembly protein CpaF